MRAFVGFDPGSAFTKAVLLLEDGTAALSLCRQKDRGDAAALRQFFGDVGRLCPAAEVSLGIVGAGASRAVPVNAIHATAAAVRLLHPEARSIIEVGAHTLKFIVFSATGEVRDFATNEACAAGTGSFLEQQARRLTLTVEELAELAAGAKRGATIAGRCSVFAASDMIHLQQKATPLAEIAYGLCLAIARNCMSSLLKGRDVEMPLVIAGGCARSRGIVRAFREVCGGEDPMVSAHPGLEAAIGAAMEARESGAPPLSLEEARQIVEQLIAASHLRPTSLPPLRPPSSRALDHEPAEAAETLTEGYLGVDVGSVSTDLVVLDAGGEVISSAYLPTRGRPAEVLGEALALIRTRFPNLRVLGCGTTGSGRHLASKLVGADVTRNEITCQLLGARKYFPDVDTILEIGGQDSKFISVRDGSISDFAMNKVCAAGTGSFLEEQSRDLAVDVFRDYAPRALAAAAPPDLGARCTVFMATEVTSALGGGTPVEELCAGLAYSIVRNYLDKVVGSRPLGKRIVFQGGVASNAAVVAAFESVLGHPVSVHPYNRISGAIGAALAAKEGRSRSRVPSAFHGLDVNRPPKLRSFECHKCSNRCEVNVIETGNGSRERAFFGDTCERYTSRGTPQPCEVPNLADEYQQECEAMFSPLSGARLRIGIPRASSLVANLAFWAAFWKELGHQPVLSEASSQETLSRGLKHLSVGVCLPMKLTAGHVHSFGARKVDHLFVPAVVTFEGDDAARSFSCPYTMAVPFMIGSAGRTSILSPLITFDGEERFAEAFDPYLGALGVSRNEVRDAYRVARTIEAELDRRFRRRASELVRKGEYRHAFAVLSRPYGAFDNYVNMGVFERLRRSGILAVPLRFLQLATGGSAPPSTLPWRFPSDMHAAAMQLGGMEGVHPLVLTSFGCGPDAFGLRQIERALGGRPHLVLELDEHRGEAGLVTRIEAFVDQLEAAAPQVRRAPGPIEETFIPSSPSTVRIPYFADIAYAFSGVFRFKGHDAAVLPLPGPEVRALGEKHSLGKECHAYSMIAGDLVKLALERPEPGTVFYFPGTSIPCLLHQYGHAMQATLPELGVDTVRVSSPSGRDLVQALGLEAAERLYMGIFAIELLSKAICQIRPYEADGGATDRAHEENLRRIEEAVAAGDIPRALDESFRRLAAIPLRREPGKRPVVGLAGDVYTKVNRVANDDLVRWLEQQGLEVWPAPCQIDLLDFGISRQFYLSVASLDLPGLLLHGGLVLRRAVDQWRLGSVFGLRAAINEEPGYLEMKKLAAPYMPNETHQLLFLNVAKIVDFAQGGADGIINAICFGCMVGNASAAVIERIRRDYDEVPIITAVYSGSDDPSRRMVLEAFAAQVKAYHRRRTASPEPTLLDRWLRFRASS